MATAKPITHVFSEINVGKYRSVKHYELQNVLNGKNQLSNLINISKDRACAKSSPIYWLQIRNGKKWVRPRLTGLFKTQWQNTYKGDTQKKTNLLMFKFSNDAQTLTVYFYPNYYTKDISSLINTITN